MLSTAKTMAAYCPGAYESDNIGMSKSQVYK